MQNATLMQVQYMSSFARIIKKNIVAVIALLLAAFSMLFVPPDKEYLHYFDWKTLVFLFSTMLIIAAFKNIRTFTIMAKSLIRRLSNTRGLVASLVFITGIGSIFIANDMALLTFLPLTLIVFKTCGKEKYTGLTIALQTVAANLGGMIMPFGNPQSLYLYSYFDIPVAKFLITMAPAFILSMISLAAISLFIKKEHAEIIIDEPVRLDKKRVLIYSLFALIALLAIFKVIHYLIAGAIVAGGFLVVDRKAYAKVDYGLMLTFSAFFVFSNNMARIETVRTAVTALTQKNVLLTGVLSCQLISNVPTAIFLSNFTNDWDALLLAVNIGGVGTLVASLASLISLREYIQEYPGKARKYILVYSVFNFAFLILLTGLAYLQLYFLPKVLF